jgi:hypothetical protein
MLLTLRWNRIAAFAALSWLSACAHQQTAPTPSPASAPASAPATAPARASAPAPAPAVASTDTPAGAPPVPADAQQRDNASQQSFSAAGATAAAVPTSKPAPSSSPRTTTSASAAPTRKVVPPAATASKPTGPAAAAATETLDLKSLEQRLRDTRAIGVFTKLSLKNQVDDLLTDMKAFHGGQPNPPLAQLRQSYESLLLKVISVLQSGDPKLASAVSSSRDALWALLSDPKKFSEIT